MKGDGSRAARLWRFVRRALVHLCVMPFARVLSHVVPRRRILRRIEAAPLGPRVVLFMHYDRSGRVRPLVLRYVKALAETGRSVVFVTNSGRLRKEAEAALRLHCAIVLVRRNSGYDFGAWAAALGALSLPRPETEEIILVNDSLFGPFAPLRPILDRIDYARADIWGLTESWQLRYHLQSFFLAAGRTAINSEAWAKFWAGVRPVGVKTYVVKHYEVGFSQVMVKAGLRLLAVWPYEQLVKQVDRKTADEAIAQEVLNEGRKDPVAETRTAQILRVREAVAARVALNPTSDLWRQLLLSGFPFIKRELVRDNPTRVRDVADWADLLRERLGTDPTPIQEDLRQMLKGSAP